MTNHIFHKESCGSKITIDILSPLDPSSLVQECFSVCDTFEERYSRFRPGNWLDTVNKTANTPVVLDEEGYALTRFALQLAEKTQGAFDPTITNTLEGHRYDAAYSFRKQERGPIGYKNILLGDHTIQLQAGVKIEFGAIGKGYLIDVIAKKLLSAGYTTFIIDFGGDIIAYGGHTIGLENPFDLTQLIGTIRVDGYAVAASNGMKRAVGEFHHLLDTATGQPVRDIAGVYISAATGLLADAYSTAVFVSGAQKGKELLAATDEISGLIVFSDGSYRKKHDYQGELFTTTQ